MANGKKKGFEALLEETEEIVEALESGELDLEEALTRYEKGVSNIRSCSKMLEGAEQKIQQLLEKDGAFELLEMAEEEDDGELEA